MFSKLTSLGPTAFAQNTALSIGDATTHHVGVEPNSVGTLRNYFDGYIADLHVIEGQIKEATDFGAFDNSGVWQAATYNGTYGNNGYYLFDFANESGIGDDSSGNDNDFTVNNISDGVYSGTKPKWYTSTTLYTTKADVIANATDRGQDGFTLSSDEFVYLVPNDGGAVGELCHPVGSEYPVLYYVYVRSSGDTSWYNTGSFGPGEADTFQWENTTGTPQAYDFTNTEDLYLIGDTRVGGQPDSNSGMSGSFPALVNLVAQTDVLFDVPTNGDSSSGTGAGGEVSGNYCTWSPLAGTNVTLSNGNLDCSLSAGTSSKARSTIAVTSGKYYWEIRFKSGQYGMIGISDASLAGSQISYAAGGLYYYVQTGGLYGDVGGSFSNTSYGSALSANDVLGVALDMDNGNVKFYKNGSDLGNANTSSLVGKTIMPHLGEGGGATFVTEANFGQHVFAYPVSGYKALCTTNLPTPTIADGSEYFEAKTFNGNNSTQTISGFEFSPDTIWCKSRSNAYNHQIWDRVRGDNEVLRPNTTDAEQTYSGSLVFTSDGFTSNTNNNANYVPEGAGSASIAWAWDAGSSTVSNTDGSITSSVRANQTAGFSIVTFTGTGSSASVGHGLNAAPSMVIAKNRDTSNDWPVWHANTSAATYTLYLNGTAVEGAASTIWPSAPTSSVVNVGSGAVINGSSQSTVLYCMSPVSGYSAFGSYVGNSSDANGPFVFTGMRPRWIMIKASTHTSDWAIIDTARNTFNPLDTTLDANNNGADSTSSNNYVDILSNGFKLRTSTHPFNAGYTYIYAAFAENPFQANGGLAR